MKPSPFYRLLCTLVPACASLVACGGGGGGSTPAPAPSYVAATSASFSPTTARASTNQNVALHWVYSVNNGLPISASLSGVTVGITVSSAEVTLAPGNLQRVSSYQGPVSASSNGVSYTGTFSATQGESLTLGTGKTFIGTESSEVNLTLTGGGQSASVNVTATIGSFAPAYEWFLDRENLDQLAVGHVETVTSSGTGDFNVTATGLAPIVRTNQPTTVNDRWTVLEKLPTMVVRGKTYSNVVRLSRQTQVPDFSGNLTTATMTYWVAKGVGMIRGEGTFRILNLDNVVYELTETNLTQQ